MMKKKIPIALIFMILFILAGRGQLFPKSQSIIRFFSPRSLYIYLMGSYNYFTPPMDYNLTMGSASSDAFAPVVGIGYRVVNFWDRLFISLEGDFSMARYNFGDAARNRDISLLTFMFNLEGTVYPKFPLLVYCGVGVGFHRLADLGYENIWGDYIRYGDDHLTVLALDLGIKIPISHHLLIRTEFQWNGEVYGNFAYGDEYWNDEWNNTQWDFLSSSVSVGLEFHF